MTADLLSFAADAGVVILLVLAVAMLLVAVSLVVVAPLHRGAMALRAKARRDQRPRPGE